MKTISFKFLAIFMLLSGFFLFVGCSKEDSQENVEIDNSMLQRFSFNSEVDDFVDKFYKDNFEFGESRETSDEANTYLVTEVLVNSETSARGYVVTEKSTDKFLYFVDVDRVDFKLTTVDILVNSTKVFTEINNHEDFLITNKFDFIKIVDNANSNPQQRRRFWGWSGWQPMGPCENGQQAVVNVHYVLWLTNVRDYDVRPC